MDIDVMAIGAHPDDVEIGMAGTLLALKAQGYSVVVVDLSDGEPTPFGSHEQRLVECQQSASLLGVDKRITLDMVNREIMDTVENRKQLASVIREYKPRLIFAPFWEDGHPDHIQAARLAQSARFYAKFVKTDMPFTPHYPARLFAYFCNHLRLRIQPAFIFDISAFIEQKQDVLRQYATQFLNNEKNKHVLDLIKMENAYWGRQIYTAYGEPFMSLESIAIKSARNLFDV